MIWVAPVAGLLVGVALLAAVAPFVRNRSPRFQRVAGELEDRRLQALRRLRDVERDHARGAVAGSNYEDLRRRAAAEAAEVIRRLDDGGQRAELAAAMRSQARSRRRPQTQRHGPSRTKVFAAIAGAALLATAVVALAGAVSGRSPGGFITGTQPSGAGSSSAIALQQRVQDHPDDLEARLDLAQTYLEAGQPKDASQQYIEVLKRDPSNPEATTRLALLVYEAGDTDHALQGVEKVLTQHPDYPEALFLKGVILLNAENRPQDAIAPLERYLQVAPTGGYRSDAEQLLNEARAQGG